MNFTGEHLKVRDDPVIIGAVGGSGTRVFKMAVELAGYFMGTYVNTNKDAVPLRMFFRSWSHQWLKLYEQSIAGLSSSVAIQKMREEFYRAVDSHLNSLPKLSSPWGFKVPKSLLFLQFLQWIYPKMKFIHVIRNGLDMVYSRNWRVRFNSEGVLEKEEQKLPEYLQRILYWSRVNDIASKYAKKHLGENYIRIRFEDMCATPENVIQRLLDFLNISNKYNLDAAVSEIGLPNSVGRWRNHPTEEIFEIMKVGRPGLEHFGYWNPNIWQKIECVMHGPNWRRWVFQRVDMKRMPAW